MSGRLAKLAETEKAKGAKYPQAIYMQQGGVSAKKLELRGQKRPDGKSLSRVFKIVPGDKYPFMVQAEQGAGEENDKGLIVSKFGGKPELRVMIPMQSDDTKKFVLMIGAKIRAYMAAQYVYFNKEEYAKQAKEEKDKMESFRKAKLNNSYCHPVNLMTGCFFVVKRIKVIKSTFQAYSKSYLLERPKTKKSFLFDNSQFIIEKVKTTRRQPSWTEP